VVEGARLEEKGRLFFGKKGGGDIQSTRKVVISTGEE